MDMFLMLFQVVWINQDVIEVDYHIYIDQVVKDVGHKALKGCGGVHESEWHDKIFEHTVAGAESSFPFVPFSYPHIVIPNMEVDLWVDFGQVQLVDKGLYLGDWVVVLLSNFVETSIIDTEAKSTAFLLGE